jgi:hypothetical protein
MAKIAAALPALGGLGGIGSILGSIGSIASAIGAVQGLSGKKQQAMPQIQATPAPAPTATEEPFAPKKPEAFAKPVGLGFEGYDPTQERTALATRGVNTGLGQSEDAYYRNLVSRSLIGDDNKIAPNANSLMPVESQYFSGKGYDTSNVNNLLKAIMGG